MKKLVFGLIATVMFSVTGNAQDVSKLAQDVDFKNYIKNEISFLQKANNIKLANQIFSDLKVDDKEISLFYQLFSTNEKSYNSFLINQVFLLKSLEKKYTLSKISNLVLVSLFEKEIALNYSVNSSNSKFIGRNCVKKYYTALGIAATAAYVGHVGCISFDLAVLPGIACHSAVAIGQYLAGENAAMELEDCLNN